MTDHTSTSPLSVDKGCKLKLVDYESSSEDEQDIIGDTDPIAVTSHKSKLQISRYNSDQSFFSTDVNNGPDFDVNSDSGTDGDQLFVGTSGLRKKRKVDKKNEKRKQSLFGKGRQINEVPCKARCQNNCALSFTEIERHEVHEFYWGLGNYERQRNWLLSCVEDVPIRRRVQTASTSRRQHTFKYYLYWNDRRVEVCQQFLLKTIDVSQMTLRYAVSNAVQKSAKPDCRGKHPPHNKTSAAVKTEVHNFVKKLPAVPSHYCRNKSMRKYLPSEFRNMSFLYRLFIKHQETEGLHGNPSLKIFSEIFLRDFNVGFHQPKKDKCRLCESKKNSSAQETDDSREVFTKHLEMKEQSKQLFLIDQKKHISDESYICASFDLQKVLNTPHGDNLLLYYSRKYAFYNETVYESGRRKQNYDVMSEILYPRKLPITIPKKNDLDKLCKENIIPERYHQEFLDLRSTAKKRDTLPETDAEDLTDEEDNQI
nr:unnamed protein product [Callosobruchus chinensis]